VPLKLILLPLPSLDGLDPDLKSLITISSKSFDPKAFLSFLHRDASMEDLDEAIPFLEKSIAGKEGEIEELMDENLNAFVRVKMNNDGEC
jgi:exocyst complex component 2